MAALALADKMTDNLPLRYQKPRKSMALAANHTAPSDAPATTRRLSVGFAAKPALARRGHIDAPVVDASGHMVDALSFAIDVALDDAVSRAMALPQMRLVGLRCNRNRKRTQDNSFAVSVLPVLSVRLDRDHGFQSIVIINSRAS